MLRLIDYLLTRNRVKVGFKRMDYKEGWLHV